MRESAEFLNLNFISIYDEVEKKFMGAGKPEYRINLQCNGIVSLDFNWEVSDLGKVGVVHKFLKNPTKKHLEGILQVSAYGWGLSTILKIGNGMTSKDFIGALAYILYNDWRSSFNNVHSWKCVGRMGKLVLVIGNLLSGELEMVVPEYISYNNKTAKDFMDKRRIVSLGRDVGMVMLGTSYADPKKQRDILSKWIMSEAGRKSIVDFEQERSEVVKLTKTVSVERIKRILKESIVFKGKTILGVRVNGKLYEYAKEENNA